MNIYEIDWRYSWVQRIFEALSEGLKSVWHDYDEAEQSDESYFDVDMALEEANALLGIAFVTAQTYITGTVADINKITKAGTKLKKDQLLKNHNGYLVGLGVTKLEFCDAMANYFKHQDEWPDWSASGHHQRTVSVLQNAGINQKDEYICVKAMEILLQIKEYDLTPLLQLLSTWRKSVIESIKPK
jgi:hypothetical protein